MLLQLTLLYLQTVLFSSHCPGDLGFVYPTETGLPPYMGTGIAPERLYWVSEALSHKLLYWERAAGSSLPELKYLSMVFVHGVTILGLARQGPCLGAGQGQRPRRPWCPLRLLHMQHPVGSFAVTSAVLLLQIGP